MTVPIINKSKNDYPKYANEGDAGCDLRADLENPITIRPLSGAIIPTGIYIAIPMGYEGQVRGRSGLNFKNDIICPVGTVDSGYRGEVKVKLYNLGQIPFTINPGDRIAQLVFAKVEKAMFVQTDVFTDETERGEGGFGSSGMN